MNSRISLFFTLFIVVCIVRQSHAQICYGSTGQPTFSYTFPEGKFTGYTSFSATASKPFKGSYTFTASTAQLDDSWRNETATGDSRIAVFNVPATPEIIYRETFTTLCASTTYSLRLIGGGVEKYGEQTQLTFSARTAAGVNTFQCYTSLASFFGSEYGITFTTPATGGDVEITVTGQAARGDQTWFGLSGIVLANCGPPMRAIADYNANSQNVISVCEGDTKAFHFALETAEDYPDPFYQWQMFDNAVKQWINIYGATSKTYTYNLLNALPGKYLFRVSSGRSMYKNLPTCTSNSAELTLNVFKNPVAVATLGTTGCEGESIVLNGSGGSGYFWTGPNGFSSTQQNPEIKNAMQANAGTYHLTVSQNDCSSTADINVVVNVKPIISAGINATICKGNKITLTPSGGVTYKWARAASLSDTTIANPLASPLVTTTYKVTGFSAAGCKNEALVTITVNPPPIADAGLDKQIFKNQPVVLYGKAPNASAFYWTPTDFLSDAHSLNPTATPPHDMVYTLHALPLTGCVIEVTDDVLIKTVDRVIIPKVFTPNGDGINDNWVIAGIESYNRALVQIFNRYGTQVYQSANYTPWDGKWGSKPIPAGTYYYRINLKNGSVLSGPVTIIR